MQNVWGGISVRAAGVGLVMLLLTASVSANSKVAEFSSQLRKAERKQFEAWYIAQIAHEEAMTTYWDKVELLRKRRRQKRRDKIAFKDRDYVTTLPPVYQGPKLKTRLLQRWNAFQNKDKPVAAKPDELPSVADYLRSAKRHYNFVPERIPEREYKRRYAMEALSHGLTKDQVVRIFALETGGNGTADMQAGIHPTKKTGRPISSALGYAQLLAANSINVIAKHGPKFVTRLQRIIKRERVPQRRKELQAKLASLQAMVRTAKSIPYKWSRQRALARTSLGMGLHPLNIDGLIGPWMQVVKLADIKELAERNGLTNLPGAELELMNLAGPGTGLEMMKPVGRDKPTTNFFSRRGYYRNAIVRGRTSQELIVALDERMDANLKKKGSQEFLAVFDEIIARRNGPVRPAALNAKPAGN